MTVDCDVIRRVGEDGRGALGSHQEDMCQFVSRIAANDFVTPDEPKVARPTDGRTGHPRDRRLLDLRLSCDERFDAQVDLAHVEANRPDVEFEFDAGQRLELFGEQPIIPDRDLGQAVVGDHEGSLLGFGQMLEANDRRRAPAQPLGGKQPPMAGDHVVIGVDQHRDIEPERLDAIGDLPDLFSAVLACVARVGFEAIDRKVRNRKRQATWRL